MDDQAFEQLVSRLEQMSLEQPRRYVVSVIGVALLGFLVLGLALSFSILIAALLVGFAVLVFVTGGKALILLAKLGKVLILLAIPAWTMVKSSFTLLFSRFSRPQGRTLQQEEAPALFECLSQLRQRMHGPRVHKVLLTDEINAAIVQYPRFGLFGWEENYLILGFPLLQTLSEAEALAVVAHEYGHLSGHHSRLGGFIYRFRLSWGRLQHLSEQWNDWGSRLIARLFRWYAPYFNAYTFVLARQNEYFADRSAAEVAGAQNAANALMRVNIATQFEHEEFWPSIERRVAQEPEPLHSRSAYWTQSVHTILDEPMRTRLLETASQRKTDHLDTHPALSDRLAAIGITADEAAARQLAPPLTSAAKAWLGSSLETLQAEFDKLWQQDIAERWHTRHTYLRERQQHLERLAELEAQQSLTLETRWEQIKLQQELNPESDLLPRVNALLAEAPSHLSALYLRGTLLLEREDEAGIDDLEQVMREDAEAILASCEAAWRFYKTRDPEKTEHYAQRWQARSDHEARVRAELETLPADANLVPVDLEQETLDKIRAILREHGKYIRRAYLLRRNLKTDAQVHDYVLAFDTKYFTLRDKSQAVIDKLVQQEFPLRMFIVHLGKYPYKLFRKNIKQLQIPEINFRE